MRLRRLVLAGALLWPAVSAANQLAEIYDLAKDKDAQFAAAQAAVRAGREAYPQARAAALPSLSARASVTQTDRQVEETPFSNSTGSSQPSAPFSDSFHAQTYGVELRQPIFDWGIPATLRTGKAQVDIAELDFATAKEKLLARVMQRYLNFLSAAEALQFARTEKRALAEDLDRAQARYDVGETDVTGLREAQAASDLAATRVIDAQTSLDDAREALRETTTMWYQRLPGLTGEIPTAPPKPHGAEAWVDIAMQYNAVYLSAVRNADIAENEITRRQSGYLPNLDVVAGYAATDDSDFVFGSQSNDTSIGLQATWRLFSGGRTFSEVRESRARYDQAQAEVTSTRRQVASAVRNAYRRVVQGISRVQALQQAIESARAALDATEAGLEVGERTQADVLDARRDLYRALTDHATARYDYLEGVVALKLNAGILSAEDLQHLDARLSGARLPAHAGASEQE